MSFKGYLIKINGVIFPSNMIQLKSYKATPDQIQDKDSYQDGDGELHRNVLPHRRSKIEFNTKLFHLADKIKMQTLFGDRVKLSVEYWNDATNGYCLGDFYIPDITYEIYRTTSDDIVYNPIRIALIEY